MAKFSLAVSSGRVNISKDQWGRMHPTVSALFVPVITRCGLMYRYIEAPPMSVDDLVLTSSDESEDYGWFKLLVQEFIDVLHGLDYVWLVEGDEDFEFTYGAFCTALATLGQSESDWILSRAFGEQYEVRRYIESDDDPNE